VINALIFLKANAADRQKLLPFHKVRKSAESRPRKYDLVDFALDDSLCELRILVFRC
jgi:hypothetical protein